MRRIRLIVVASGIMMAGLLGWTVGCAEKAPDDVGPGTGDMDASAPVELPVPACMGDPTKDAKLITKECAVFARADASSTGEGTPEAPYKSLGDAIKAASDTTGGKKARWVIACASADFTENVTISRAVSLYGAFDCASGWAYNPESKAKLTSAADIIPLTITHDGVKITSLSVEAIDAKTEGGSSIAVLVNRAEASFELCDVKAGSGSKGKNGDAPASKQAANGNTGSPGTNACTGSTSPGAEPVISMCGTVNSIGGAGGASRTDNGDSGGAGLPSNGGGKAGQGRENAPMSSWSCAVEGNGGAGVPGKDGSAGAGATTETGTLAATGFTGAAGKDGKPGEPGQGGGGGGGNLGKGHGCMMMMPGASGGSGGSGGCGGAAGKAGLGGGASIAIASIDSGALSLFQVTLTTGAGGDGGIGGDLQLGGTAGQGGAGGKGKNMNGDDDGCRGGDGGKGGTGGSGGGGRGGPSVGIAFTVTKPVIDMAKVPFNPGKGGKGGAGGNSNAQNNAGATGIEGLLVEFTPPGH